MWLQLMAEIAVVPKQLLSPYITANLDILRTFNLLSPSNTIPQSSKKPCMLTTTPTDHVSIDMVESTTLTTETANQEAVLPKLTGYACVPSGTQRYDFNRTVEDKQPYRMIQPLTVSFPAESTLPPGWEHHNHPGGLPYFVLSLPDGGQMRRIVTEEWMYDPDISTLIHDFIKQIQDAISDRKITIWPESDLFIELQRKKGRLTKADGHARCGYYFVHHERRCIYWLEGLELNPSVSLPLRNMRGDLTGYQTQLCLEVEYWMYWSLFPTLHSVTPNIHDYVVDTITNVSTDVISSPTSSTIFTYESLNQMLKVVRMAKGCNTSSWYIGHFMYQLINDQLRNYSGVWGTRLNRDQSLIRKVPKPQSLLLDIISPFLFFIPHAQLERVEAVIVDGCVILHEWEEFIDQLQEERKGTIMIATGTIVVNFISQAGPSFRSQTVELYASWLQFASDLSLIMSLFGAILAVLMSRDQKFKRKYRWHWTADKIYAYIYGTSAGEFDYTKLEHLVLIWSVPHALVVWSIIVLSTTWLFFFFMGTSTATKIALGVPISLFGSLTLYYFVRFKIVTKLLAIWFGSIIEHLKVASGRKVCKAVD